MWIISCLLLIIGTAAGVCGSGFLIRNQKATGRMRYYILAYGVSSALWCILFGMIGFCDDLSLCHALRRIADIGVVSFLIAEAFLVTDICGVNGRIARACKAISIVLGVVDYLFFAQDKVNTFVRMGNCTTWVAHPEGAVNRAVHSAYIAITWKSRIFTVSPIIRHHIENYCLRNGILRSDRLFLITERAVKSSLLSSADI